MNGLTERGWLRALALAALFASIAGSPALGQVTGDLQINVVDAKNEPLPGALVVIQSPAQIGQRSASTNTSGIARFNAVVPGTYQVTVSFQGFGTVIVEGNDVELGNLTQVPVQLREQMTETVTVTAQTPLVDPATTATGQEFDLDFVDTLPTTRSYQSNLILAPGVDSGSNPSVHGGTDTDNIYLIDGINTTDPVTGTFGSNLNFEIIDQQQITTAGHPAEYGMVVGLVSNLVTKSGGNDFSGSVNYFKSDSSWGSPPGENAVAAPKTDSWSSALTFGGPVLKDRLWFFLAWETNESQTQYDIGTLEVRERSFEGDYGFGKVSLQLTSNHRLNLSYNTDPADILNANANDATIGVDQFRKQEQGGYGTALRYTGVLTPNVVLEGAVQMFRSDLDSFPQYPDLGPNITGIGTTEQFGRYSNAQFSDRDRDEARLDLSWFTDAGPGDHNFKFGTYAMQTDFYSLNINSGQERYTNRTAAGRTLWSIFGGTAVNRRSLFSQFEGFEAYNQGFSCFVNPSGTLIPCVDFAGDPATLTAASQFVLDVNGTPYTPDLFTFDAPSENADAADAGWVKYISFRDSQLDQVGTVGQDLLAFYAQDDWRIGKSNISYGVRVEQQKLNDSRGQEFFKFDTTISPRLGYSYDVKGDGTMKLWAHYGRLYDPLRDNTSSFAGQYGEPLLDQGRWLEPLGNYYTYFQSGGPGTPGAAIAPNLETPYTDELLGGFAWQFANNQSVELVVINRKTKNVTEDWDPIFGTDTGLYSSPTLAELGFTDRNGDGVVDENDLDSAFVVYNPPGGERKFDGLDLTYRRRFSNNWTGIASYSYGDFEGNVPDDGLYGLIGDDPYLDPRNPYNNGRLDFSREHFLKFYGSYKFQSGWTVGGSWQLRSGIPYSMTVTSTQGSDGPWDGDPFTLLNSLSDVDIAAFEADLGIPEGPELYEAIVRQIPYELRAGRGAYRSNWYGFFNARVKYDFNMWKKLNGELFLDIFNVLNQQKPTEIGGDIVANTTIDPDTVGLRSTYTFQDVRATQAPRSFQLGVRFAF